MPIPIEMPKLSDTMTEGTLLKWLKKEGDTVAAGDVIAEIETDKATMEMEVFDDGVLHKFYAKEGDKVAVGAKLALLLEEGEDAPADDEAPEAKKTEKPKETKSEDAAPKSKGKDSAAPAKEDAPSGGRVKASPLARKVAEEKGVDLSKLTGTGPGGRIVEKDVLAAAKSGGSAPAPQKSGTAPAAAAPKSAPTPPAPLASAGTQEIVPLSNMRRIIADRLLESKTTIPHFYLNIEIDGAPLMKLRAEINAASEAAGHPKLTVNDFVLKAAIVAMKTNPFVNASFTSEGIVKYGSVNLAVAVAIDDGLVTPVLRDAQTKSIREISAAVKDLATRARNKKLKPDEFQNGTFTVSNLGAYGIESFDAIINPPQAAILAVGALVKKPVVHENGQIVAGQRMAIGMSCDHRVVDGAVGAQYLADLKRLLENPALMLL